MISAHMIVSGRVQGVGYRAFVLSEARRIDNITGWVRNLQDGYKVEVIAEGSDENINFLIKRLWAGPYLSDVKNIEINKDKISKRKYNNFEIVLSKN